MSNDELYGSRNKDTKTKTTIIVIPLLFRHN